MKKFEKLMAEMAMDNRLAVEDIAKPGKRRGSTASHCKKADYKVRDYLMAKGVGTTDDVRCRPGSKHDWELYVRKAKVVGETKVGCGALAYANDPDDLSFDPDSIYPDVDFVAYCVDNKRLRSHPEQFATLFRVFTRAQFIAVLEDCGRKGLESSLRIHQSTSGTWQLEIQPWATKQTAARLGKYEDWVAANGIPTLEEFRRVLRG